MKPTDGQKPPTQPRDPYMYPWCSYCRLLRDCYFQHGEKSRTPWLIDPTSCPDGPAR